MLDCSKCSGTFRNADAIIAYSGRVQDALDARGA